MKKRNSYIILISIILLGVAIDLVTKIIFADVLAQGDIVIIPNFFRLTYVENTGAAFGIMGDSTVLLILISLVFIVAFVIFDIFNHSTNWLYTIGVGLIMAGAIGNFVDRIFLGYVRDFVSIRLFDFVFNIADMWITFGIILFAIYLVISMVKETKAKKGTKDDNAVDNK